MKHLKSFREYIEALKEIDEIVEVQQEVDWNLEMGAIIRHATETRAPAVLFNRIKEYEPGFRVLGAPWGPSRKPNAPWARMAIAMGLPPDTSAPNLVEAYLAAKSRPALPPKVVSQQDAPCKENILTGEQVDLYKIPVPYIHDGDGGRYDQTAGINIVQSPDGKWVTWSTNRGMLVDKNHRTGLVIPEQHIGMIHQEWKKLGQPTPWALALGVPPVAALAGGSPLPAYVNEHDFYSQFTGEPAEVVKCETVDIYVPASSEIVIEGYISNTEMAPEGPFGEYGGYVFGAGEPWPLFTVTAITYRHNAILPVIAPGYPIEDVQILWGIGVSAEAKYALQQAGLPVTDCWTPPEAATHWLVVTVPRDWHDQTGLGVHDYLHKIGDVVFNSHAGWQFPKILVMGDDIDPEDIHQVVWAFATRCHPGSGEILFSKTKVGFWVAYLDSSEKMTGRGGQALYNCLMHDQAFGKELPGVSAFSAAYPQALQKKVLENWTKYGFSPNGNVASLGYRGHGWGQEQLSEK